MGVVAKFLGGAIVVAAMAATAPGNATTISYSGVSGASVRDSENIKPWHRDSENIKPWHRDSENIKPWHRDSENIKPWHRDSENIKPW